MGNDDALSSQFTHPFHHHRIVWRYVELLKSVMRWLRLFCRTDLNDIHLFDIYESVSSAVLNKHVNPSNQAFALCIILRNDAEWFIQENPT